MGLLLNVGLCVLLIVNNGLQDVNGKKPPSNDENGTKNTQINVPPQTTGEETVHDTPTGDKHIGNEDSSGKTTTEQQNKKMKGKSENLDEKTVQQSTNDNKPGFLKRMSSKLPFSKSGKASDIKTISASDSVKSGSKVEGITGNGEGKDTPTESSSSESSSSSHKSKNVKGQSEKNVGNKKNKKDLKGAEKESGIKKESSINSEADKNKQDTRIGKRKSGKSLEAGQEKDLSSESSNDNEKHIERENQIGAGQNSGSPKDTQSSSMDTGVKQDKDSVEKSTNVQQATDTDHPPDEQKLAKKKSFIRRPHLPGPNIGQLLSRNKEKKQE